MNKIFLIFLMILLLLSSVSAKDVREIRVINIVYGNESEEIMNIINKQDTGTRSFFMMNTDNKILLSFDTIFMKADNISMETYYNQSWIAPEGVQLFDEYDLRYVRFLIEDKSISAKGVYIPEFEIIEQPILYTNLTEYNVWRAKWTEIHEIIHFFGFKFNDQNLTGFEDIDNQLANTSELPTQIFVDTLRNWDRWDELKIGKLKPLGLVFDINRNQKIEKDEALEAIEYYMNGYEGYSGKEIVTAAIIEYFS